MATPCWRGWRPVVRCWLGIEANRSLVEDGVTGFVFDVLTSSKKGRAARGLPSARQRLGEAGRAVVEGRYPPEREIEGYAALYRQLTTVGPECRPRPSREHHAVDALTPAGPPPICFDSMHRDARRGRRKVCIGIVSGSRWRTCRPAHTDCRPQRPGKGVWMNQEARVRRLRPSVRVSPRECQEVIVGTTTSSRRPGRALLRRARVARGGAGSRKTLLVKTLARAWSCRSRASSSRRT